MTPLGYLAWLPGSAAAAVGDVLTLLPSDADPVAVAAPYAHIRAFAGVRFGRRVRLFSTADYGRTAGESVAEYLLARGHTRVLGLAPTIDQEEAQWRMEGLSAVLGSAGARFDLCSYDVPPRPPRGERRDALGAVGDLVRAIRGRVTLSAPLKRTLDAVIAARGEVRRQMELAGLSESVRKAYDAVPGSLRPTAVVCWNDDCAAALLSVLRRKHVTVPRDLSIISFDDTVTASLVDVASYNFNESRVLLSMLDWVLWPTVLRGDSVQLPPNGFITQRGTVRTLRAPSS
jgi:hypothetical protein